MEDTKVNRPVYEGNPNSCFNVGVYGTLREGKHNHALLHGFNSHGCNRSNEGANIREICGYKMFVMTDPANAAGYSHIPFIVHTGKPEDVVTIELYSAGARMYCWEEMLSRLDILEGHPAWYRRAKILTTKGELAWVYIFTNTLYKEYKKNKRAKIVPSGDYLSPELDVTPCIEVIEIQEDST